MKKFNLTRILVLVLSLALLIGSVMAISVAADGASAKGEFGGISVAYGEKVAIRVAVNATEEEIRNGDVVVSYTVGGNTENATYYETKDGFAWVITEGFAAYELAEEVTFSSSANGEPVESGRKYSVAQFLYAMLYTNSGISEEYRALYNNLLAYGESAQIALNINASSLVTDSSIAFTNNDQITLNGSDYAFAPAKDLEITPALKNGVSAGYELIGWNVIVDGEEETKGPSFTVSGVVEVVSPIIEASFDPTPYTLANGGFENGLEGWTLVGNIGSVSSATHYWVGDADRAEGYLFGMDGEKMFSAYEGGDEAAVGTLTSSSFKVGGSGFVTFKVGAMKDGNYVYVDVVDAQTKEILARYYNGNWADTTDGAKSGCTLVPYKADLSMFMGREVFFRLSDNADSGYGLFFADSFNTYYPIEPDGNSFNPATPVNYEVSGTVYDVFNGGFEYGDNRGWWNNGEPGAVTGADAFFSGVAYGKDGDYLYSGVEDHGAGNGREGNTGTLTSSAFLLGGSGYITYMLGGGNELCYVQVIDSTTGEVLARFRQQAREDAVLKSYVADLSAYVGKTVRIQVVDNATNSWGCVSFDNVKTYYASKPDGYIDAVDVKEADKYSIVNGSFEYGMDGWKMNVTEASEFNTLGWVLDKEVESVHYSKNDDRKQGNYLFTFWHNDGRNCEGSKGNLESSAFTLKKDSYVSFRFGGAGNAQNHDVYIQLCRADGTAIATFYNDAEGKVNTQMNAYFYQYTGEETECFFRVVDNSAGDYGCFVVDDFRVNLESAPEGFIEAIQ
ncbi:MAG: hypothetical protein IJ488_08370 [Clostridia bacterium]|nr:hypothetical protein [Clostridia bacterium]